MRSYFIAGNWKMHKTVGESVELAKALVKELASCKHRVMIAPAFTSLAAVAEVVKGTNIELGAQNMGQDLQGAHTGEVSPLMLKDVGVKVVILGHSERRHTYLESDALINKKVLLAIDQGFDVILCIGETLEERESGKLESVISTQVKEGLKGVAKESLKKITLAYEPVWAIGTGKTATPEDADAVHAYTRKLIEEMYGKEAAEEIIIQYGGSVKPENAAILMAKPNIDGALVGGAALKVDSFTKIACFD